MSYRCLQEGDVVGVVACAGPAEPEHLALIEPLFERYGQRARLFPSCFRRTGFLAGSDEERLHDLHAAFADPDVAMIISLRGGYGSARLLDRIDTAVLQRQPKLLIGYSDITALHALLHRAGLASLHGPMPASDLVREGREADADALFTLLRSGLVAGQVQRPSLLRAALQVDGVAEGTLIGGNLSLVVSLLGTPWAWNPAGAILFLEDINEEPYKVDRLFNQLRLAGVLDAASGFLIGSFSEQAFPAEVLRHYLAPLRKPVLGGWPAGHGTPNRALPMGLRVRLDASGGTLTMLDDLLTPP